MTTDEDRPPRAGQSVVGDVAAALLLLSRLPATWHSFPEHNPPNFTSALWAFPLVGVIVGGAGGVILVTAAELGLPPMAAAALALVGIAMLSGAMHEDGLADMADGFGGGHDSQSVMRIMHDSRIGAYGVLALILATTLRLALLVFCLGQFSGWHLVGFMALIGGASRFQPVLQLAVFPLSPHASLAALTGRPGPARLIVAFALWAPAMVWLLGAVPAAMIAIPACMLSLWIGRLATRRVEGLTGDVMGATILISDIFMMMSFACAGTVLPA